MESVKEISLKTLNAVKQFCFIAEKYDFEIYLSVRKFCVDGTSLLGVLSLPLTEMLRCTVIYKEEQKSLVLDFWNKISEYIEKNDEE